MMKCELCKKMFPEKIMVICKTCHKPFNIACGIKHQHRGFAPAWYETYYIRDICKKCHKKKQLNANRLCLTCVDKLTVVQ